MALQDLATVEMVRNVINGTTPVEKAKNATNDGAGNNIANTYARKDGTGLGFFDTTTQTFTPESVSYADGVATINGTLKTANGAEETDSSFALSLPIEAGEGVTIAPNSAGDGLVVSASGGGKLYLHNVKLTLSENGLSGGDKSSGEITLFIINNNSNKFSSLDDFLNYIKEKYNKSWIQGVGGFSNYYMNNYEGRESLYAFRYTPDSWFDYQIMHDGGYTYSTIPTNIDEDEPIPVDDN